MQRLAGGSSDAALIPVLEGYANANLAASDRKPVQQAIDRIRVGIRRQLPAHPQRDGRLAGRRTGSARQPGRLSADEFRYRRALASVFGRCSRPRQLLPPRFAS